MTSFVSIVELPASPEASWVFIVDHGSEIEPLSFQPTREQGVGTLNELVARVARIPVRAVSRTLEWDPPRRCVFESVKPSWPIRARITETFEPSATGTRHTIEYEVEPRGLIGRAVAPAMCRFMRHNRKIYQERLRSALAASNPS